MTDKENFILELLNNSMKEANCLRRNYACVISRGNNFYTGHTYSITGCETCLREQMDVPSGHRYELCKSIHAEQMALLKAGYHAEGATLYLMGIEKGKIIKSPKPCLICLKMILYAEVDKIITWDGEEFKELDMNELISEL